MELPKGINKRRDLVHLPKKPILTATYKLYKLSRIELSYPVKLQ